MRAVPNQWSKRVPWQTFHLLLSDTVVIPLFFWGVSSSFFADYKTGTVSPSARWCIALDVHEHTHIITDAVIKRLTCMERRKQKSPGVGQSKDDGAKHQESDGFSLLGLCKAQLEKAAATLMCCSKPGGCPLTSVIELYLAAASDERGKRRVRTG